jgi:hypothetical protein
MAGRQKSDYSPWNLADSLLQKSQIPGRSPNNSPHSVTLQRLHGANCSLRLQKRCHWHNLASPGFKYESPINQPFAVACCLKSSYNELVQYTLSANAFSTSATCLASGMPLVFRNVWSITFAWWKIIQTHQCSDPSDWISFHYLSKLLDIIQEYKGQSATKSTCPSQSINSIWMF